MSKDKIIIVGETVVESVAKDFATMGFLAALAWFNHRFCGGSAWINAAIAVGWLCAIAQLSQRRRTPDEVREWLDRKYPTDRPA